MDEVSVPTTTQRHSPDSMGSLEEWGSLKPSLKLAILTIIEAITERENREGSIK